MKQKKIVVQAPATIANLGPGFDCLGLALDFPADTLTLIERPQKQLTAEFSGTAQGLPRELKKNTAAVALEALLQACKIKSRGFHLKIHKHFQPGSGLGSSAASAAAAVFAANQLLKLGLTREQLVVFAMLGEQAASGAMHADNVAPALLGGVVLLQSQLPLVAVQLPFPATWRLLILQPDFFLSTKKARQVLPKQIPLSVSVQQGAQLASMIAALFAGDEKLLSISLQDKIVEPLREKLIPHFRLLQDEAQSVGALAGSIAGAGPASFVIVKNASSAKKVKLHLEKVIARKKIAYKVLSASVSENGVSVVK